jgi:hypothetical protein
MPGVSGHVIKTKRHYVTIALQELVNDLVECVENLESSRSSPTCAQKFRETFCNSDDSLPPIILENCSA